VFDIEIPGNIVKAAALPDGDFQKIGTAVTVS
jgi:hypothetical protein